ncbi:MAG: ATP-binding cassette domain-containing protein [Polyangiaceae bacterium]
MHLQPLPPLVEVRDLVKRFGDKTVLDGIDLSIERGETIVVIGGSGSGKSTLARILVGLEEPSSGDVLVEGVPIASMTKRARSAARARFGMVFQKHALLDSLTVFDNVAFPLREHEHIDAEETRARVMRALRELGVDDAASKLPGELSGGMAKRVAIARATVREPEILVYDEPTSGLDPISSRTVDDLIERMREHHFVTSIVITHDMLTAYDVADRVVLLGGGKLVVDGPPELVFRSHDREIEPFAKSSGLDLASLGPRQSRKSAAEIRAAWERHARHEAPIGEPFGDEPAASSDHPSG